MFRCLSDVHVRLKRRCIFLICLRYRTTTIFRFSSLVYGLYVLLCFSNTQNPEILRFLTAHAYKYKTKRRAKMEPKTEKKLLASLPLYVQSIAKNSSAYRLLTSQENRKVVLF